MNLHLWHASIYDVIHVHSILKGANPSAFNWAERRYVQERDGVVAALRMQLRQRQQALTAQGSIEPALVAAGQFVQAQEAQPAKLDAALSRAASLIPNEHSMPAQQVSSRAAELEAVWSLSLDPAR